MEKQLIPQLRFPEFVGEWEIKTLKKLLINFKLGGNYSNSDKITSRPLIKMGNLGRGNIKIDKIQYIATDEVVDEDDKIKKGDLFFNTRNTLELVGKVAIWNNELPIAYYNSNLMRLEFENNWFMNYRLNSFQGVKGLKRFATGTTSVAAIYTKDLLKLKLSTPSLPEQQKIASFLTDVDAKITKLTKKKELLKQYKKGIMQKIFNQELRFKDDNGNDFPKWEEKKLGVITKYYDGTHQTPNYVSEGIPFYSVEHVTANQFEKTKYISKEVFEKENKRVKLEKGDILMTRIGNVGKARYIDWDVKASFYVSLALIKQNSSFSSKYLAQYINSVPFQRELWKRIIHVAFPIKINLGEIGKCLVRLPCLEEQTKIANFLSDIDLKIKVLNTKIEHSKSFKKGLLQQLFV